MKINCYISNKFLKDYIKQRLQTWQMNFIATHLRNCPKCMERYSKMTKIMRVQEKRRKEEELFEEISAQIDFEKLKNKTVPIDFMNIDNPKYEIYYNKIASLIGLIEDSMERTKTKAEIDIVEKVMQKIN